MRLLLYLQDFGLVFIIPTLFFFFVMINNTHNEKGRATINNYKIGRSLNRRFYHTTQHF